VPKARSLFVIARALCAHALCARSCQEQNQKIVIRNYDLEDDSSAFFRFLLKKPPEQFVKKTSLNKKWS